AGGMIERYPHNFVPGAFLPVPRTVKRGKNVAFVVSRELLTSVKAQLERGGVRLHKHIGNDQLVGKRRMFSLVARLGMIADVKPRLTVTFAGTHTADVIGRQIFAELVALV